MDERVIPYIFRILFLAELHTGSIQIVNKKNKDSNKKDDKENNTKDKSNRKENENNKKGKQSKNKKELLSKKLREKLRRKRRNFKNIMTPPNCLLLILIQVYVRIN